MNDTNNLSEEIFCLKCELETLSGVLLRRESERWIPGYLYPKTEHSHIDRYKLACTISEGLNVIDVACGAGKGSLIIATEGKASRVNGFDIDENAVRYAKWRYSSPKVEFEVKNAESLGIHEVYDLAVSFETVEHVPNYKDFLNSIVKSLKPGGRLLISTPISKLPVDNHPSNPYHVQEWGFKAFQEILGEFFEIEKVYVQLYPKPLSIWQRLKRRLNINIHEVHLSKIEEFTNQYSLRELGNTRIGYQIVLAKLKPA